MRILVTGGCGFIGSNFIRRLLNSRPDCTITNLDCLTYAAQGNNLKDCEQAGRYRLLVGRVEDPQAVSKALKDVEAVVHFAAETHVDRSITSAAPFITTNVVGTQVLLDCCRAAGVEHIVHVSTDEVYGTLGETGRFSEDSALAPRSPYAASKAAADLLCQAWFETYNLPVVIVRPSNNYGPYQFPEKFIPLAITNLLEGKHIPVYGRGQNVRDWVFVEDTCRALELVLDRGRPGRAYNIGANCELPNLEVARAVAGLLGKGEDAIEFVPDRPGHDFRYALDTSRIASELGWTPQLSFANGLEATVRWYQENAGWWQPLKARLQSESRGFWTGGAGRAGLP
ncbi:MAG: dTDP-glucose 4,6-dehydratase [candidate division WOR-3 bacterium]